MEYRIYSAGEEDSECFFSEGMNAKEVNGELHYSTILHIAQSRSTLLTSEGDHRLKTRRVLDDPKLQ